MDNSYSTVLKNRIIFDFIMGKMFKPRTVKEGNPTRQGIVLSFCYLHIICFSIEINSQISEINILSILSQIINKNSVYLNKYI